MNTANIILKKILLFIRSWFALKNMPSDFRNLEAHDGGY